MRDDDAATLANRFVGAGLLGMPVRVDQRVDTSGARCLLDCGKQRIGIRRQASVDHERAVGTGHRNDVAARTLKQRRAAEVDRRYARLRGRDRRSE